LRAYDKLLDDKTTIFLPADTDALQMLHFDKQPGQVGPSSPAPRELSTGADLRQNEKREEGVR
jgi:membrane protease subunit HflC